MFGFRAPPRKRRNVVELLRDLNTSALQPKCDIAGLQKALGGFPRILKTWNFETDSEKKSWKMKSESWDILASEAKNSKFWTFLVLLILGVLLLREGGGCRINPLIKDSCWPFNKTKDCPGNLFPHPRKFMQFVSMQRRRNSFWAQKKKAWKQKLGLVNWWKTASVQNSQDIKLFQHKNQGAFLMWMKAVFLPRTVGYWGQRKSRLSTSSVRLPQYWSTVWCVIYRPLWISHLTKIYVHCAAVWNTCALVMCAVAHGQNPDTRAHPE